MQESEVNNPSSKPPKEEVKTSKAFRIVTLIAMNPSNGFIFFIF